MSNIFSRLGFGVSKTVTTPKQKSAEEQKEAQDFKEKMDQHTAVQSRIMAERCKKMMPNELFCLLMNDYDFLCQQWGGVKVVRLFSICYGILDIEIHQEVPVISKKEKERVSVILFWMCMLITVPIKEYLNRNDVPEYFRSVFMKLLIADYSLLDEAEFNLFFIGIMEGTKTTPGNPVLDIFHDALKLEEAQFGFALNTDLMRTVAGKSKVYQVVTQRASKNNVAYEWGFVFQELMRKEGFIDKDKALLNNKNDGDDGIS
jgi:hypothetical protein